MQEIVVVVGVVGRGAGCERTRGRGALTWSGGLRHRRVDSTTEVVELKGSGVGRGGGVVVADQEVAHAQQGDQED